MKKLTEFILIISAMIFFNANSFSQTGFIGSVSTGISIPTGDLSNSYVVGFNLNANGGYIFNKNFGGRGEISFNSFGFDNSGFAGFSGGTLHIVAVKGDFLAGDFSHNSKIMPYGLFGIGIYSISASDLVYGPYIFRFTGTTEFGMGLGGGAGYRINPKVALFAETQLNIVFTSGSSTTFIPFRVGAMLTP